MKIYSMTATFGKLERQTLTLQPGLNIIKAPNEWGKSTWCAFLVAMLYGIDTRVKSTKSMLADKERYVPWSGSSMSGRMDLNWNGRDITIERRTKGRAIMGEFRAYETETGIDIPELTAANCGQQLLGVEQSVFTRSAFLRFSDLPVTQDEALRRRLNALVTTGDESGAAEALGRKLKDLKNRCRYNRTGLLPQVEAQRDQLQSKIEEYNTLSNQAEKLRTRQKELEQWSASLENHKNALRYAAAKDDAARVEAAISVRDSALKHHQELQASCRLLPSRQEAEQAIQELSDLRQEWDSIHMEDQMLPSGMKLPEPPATYRGMTPDEAVAQAEDDKAALEALGLPKKPYSTLLILLGILISLCCIPLFYLNQIATCIMTLAIGAALITVGIFLNVRYRRHLSAIRSQEIALCRRYGSNNPDDWVAEAKFYQAQWNNYTSQVAANRLIRGDLDSRRDSLMQKLSTCSDAKSLSEGLDRWTQVLAAWDEHDESQRALQQAEQHLETLQAMAKTARPPVGADELTFNEDETNRLLSDATFEQRQLQHKLGQCQGQMDRLGSSEALQQELEELELRIASLEQTYAALDIAQETLAAANTELQRRFSPRISKKAQELFCQLTHGRYDRLTMGDDLSIHAGAEGENTLRSHHWRSDGTIDQLYLALRLSVASELAPDAPLILDDALVRFDDDRLATAVGILRQESVSKQVILFTCQGREKNV